VSSSLSEQDGCDLVRNKCRKQTKREEIKNAYFWVSFEEEVPFSPCTVNKMEYIAGIHELGAVNGHEFEMRLVQEGPDRRTEGD